MRTIGLERWTFGFGFRYQLPESTQVELWIFVWVSDLSESGLTWSWIFASAKCSPSLNVRQRGILRSFFSFVLCFSFFLGGGVGDLVGRMETRKWKRSTRGKRNAATMGSAGPRRCCLWSFKSVKEAYLLTHKNLISLSLRFESFILSCHVSILANHEKIGKAGIFFSQDHALVYPCTVLV